MIDSWSVPFAKTFSNSKDVHLYKVIICCCSDFMHSLIIECEILITFCIVYQVSLIDSWFLCLPPIKHFLLWTIKKPIQNENKDTLEGKMVYSFGDHYYFRKELNLENLLTGYKSFYLLIQLIITRQSYL